METTIPTKKKHYFVEFSYDDPYPRTFSIKAIQSTGPGRAVDIAYKAFKKTRARRREPSILRIKVGKIS